MVCVLHSGLPLARRQLHPCQPGGDTGGNRAGVVLPAVLRHPALDPEQAARRLRAVWLHWYLGVPALARYLAREIGPLPAAFPPVLLAVRDRLYRPGLARHQAAGRRLRDRRAHPYLLLLRVFPDRAATARHLRENQ